MTTTTTPVPSAEGAPEPAAVDEQSLRKLAIRGSIWAVGGYGASMVLRLGSNVVLWHLLVIAEYKDGRWEGWLVEIPDLRRVRSLHVEIP